MILNILDNFFVRMFCVFFVMRVREGLHNQYYITSFSLIIKKHKIARKQETMIIIIRRRGARVMVGEVGKKV